MLISECICNTERFESTELNQLDCLCSKVAGKLKVRTGEHDVSTLNEPLRHDEYDVAEIIINPQVNCASDIAYFTTQLIQFNNNTLANDMALLRLATPVKKKANVNIVCLPNEDTFTDEQLLSSKCYITGWGRRTESEWTLQLTSMISSLFALQPGTAHSLILKEVPVPLWKNDECEVALKKHFGQNYRLPSRAVCAGAEGSDACDVSCIQLFNHH